MSAIAQSRRRSGRRATLDQSSPTTTPAAPAPSVVSPPTPFQPAALGLVKTILEGAGSLSANVANDAYKLAAELHNARDPLAMTAIEIARDCDKIAVYAHRAAEVAAEIAGLEASAIW